MEQFTSSITKSINSDKFYSYNLNNDLDVESLINKNHIIQKCPEELFLYNIIGTQNDPTSDKYIPRHYVPLKDIIYQSRNGEIVKLTDEFDFYKILGEGSFGLVLSVLDKKLSTKAALKIISKKYYNPTEKKVFKRIDHPNIVKMFRSFENSDYYFIVMELLEGRNLKDLIIERYRRDDYFFNEEECSIILKGIVDGIDFLHFENYTHRDIKPGIYNSFN
jgi:hypothetical protein